MKAIQKIRPARTGIGGGDTDVEKKKAANEAADLARVRLSAVTPFPTPMSTPLFKRSRALAAATVIVASALSPFAFADSFGPSVPTGEGSYKQWTPKSGTTHYTMVDETTCNGTTDYVSTNTVGNRDSFAVSLSSIPNGSVITQLDVTPCASRNLTGGSNPTMNVFYRFSGVNSADAGGYSLTGTTPVALATTSYAGLSLVKGASSTLDIGAVLSAGTKGARLSRIAVQATYTTLGAPTSLSATPTGTQVALAWTDNANTELGFVIERQTNGTGSFSTIAVVGTNVTAYTDTGSLANKTYAYRVRAYNMGGSSAYSNVATATTVPNAPTGLSASPSATQISLHWTDNSSVEDGFKIERSTDGTNYAQIDAVGANVVNYADTTVSLDAQYWYRVRSYNGAGDTSYSNVATATTVPNAPTSLSATPAGTQVALAWTDNANTELGFVIERQTNGTGSFSTIRVVGSNVTAYTDTGSLANKTYSYRVRAYNGAGYSVYSNVATASTVPSAPSALVTSLTGGTISLRWTDNSAVESAFRIERKSGSGAFAEIATVGANVTSAIDAPVNDTYTYRVRASNAAGFSGYTNESTITLP